MMDPQSELRKRWKVYSRALHRGDRPDYQREFDDLRCGARTRAGTPCRRRDLYASGRCRLHGGLSTGPGSGPKVKRREPPVPEPAYDPESNLEL